MNNTALITGASSGIGRELALIHAQTGGDLVLVARSGEKLNNLKEELETAYSVSVEVIVQDLSNREAPEEIYREVKDKKVEIEYLINNAGFGGYGLFHETEWDSEARMIDLNIRALSALTKLFLPEMVTRGRGKILNIASTAAFLPGPLMAVYYATKNYVLAFSEALAEELKGAGVTVTTLCPGPTRTGFQRASGIENSKLVKNKKIPDGREVAVYGYKQMIRGKRVVIPGFGNKLTDVFARLMPRKTVTTLVKKIQETA
jgi:hypothetical protein